MEALRILPGIGGWKEKDSKRLMEDYGWLRKLESVLRRFNNAAISQLPSSREEWDVPARHLGFNHAAALEAELTNRRRRIRRLTERLMRP